MRRERLIDTRKAAGKSQEQVADAVGVDRTTIGTWERGERTPQVNQRAAYAEALGVSMEELASMLSGAPVGDGEMPVWLSSYLAMEQSALKMEIYEPRAVHGLLQTSAYTEAMLSRIGITGASDTYVNTAIEQRIYRQKRVFNRDLELNLIQPESSLRVLIGNPAVMEDQLNKVLEMMSLPNVTVRVTTFEAGQYEARRLGPASIMFHPWGTPRAFIESYGGGRELSDSDEVAYFRAAFEQAARIALTPEKSRRFIAELAREWSRKR